MQAFSNYGKPWSWVEHGPLCLLLRWGLPGMKESLQLAVFSCEIIMGPQTYVQCKIFKNTLILNSSAHVNCSTLMQQLPMQRGLLHVWGDCSVSKVHIVQAWGPEFEPCVKQWRIVAQSRVVRRQRWLDPWESLNSRCAPCSVRDAVSHNRVRSKTGLWLPQGHMHMHLHVYEYMQTYTCNNKNIITCFIH